MFKVEFEQYLSKDNVIKQAEEEEEGEEMPDAVITSH